MELNDVAAFVAVVRAKGFREAARLGGSSPSSLSVAVSRLENRLGLRLLHRTTRSIALTEAGERFYARASLALTDIAETAADLTAARGRVSGQLRLNVPIAAARLVLPAIVPPFLEAHPDIRLDVVVEDGFVDILAAGCDAGVRYEERLEQDMIAIPIGPRAQRYATAAAPAYLDARGRPLHPRDLLDHACLRGRFPSGSSPAWEFEQMGEAVRIEPRGPLTVRIGSGTGLLVEAAAAGLGVIQLFEDWLRPLLDAGTLEPVLEPWWPRFSGPYLYYPGRRHVPEPLRAFIDFVR